MKHLAALLLAANGLFAADFVTGQAARAVIGQPMFTAQTPTGGTLGLDKVLGGAGGLAYANGTLVVADANFVAAAPLDNRVLIYYNLAQQIPTATADIPQSVGMRCGVCGGTPDVVLGQPDFTTTTLTLAQNGMRTPTGVATDGVRLAVADTDNNRVLIWNTLPHTIQQPADLVLGQPDFTTGAPNSQTGDVRVPSAKALRGPLGVWIQGSRLFIADTLNHRVLVWNSFPTQNFQPADVVIGQANFTSAIDADISKTPAVVDAKLLNNPTAVSSDGVRLFVTDLGNNRVLIYNSIPTENNAAADVEIGQPDMTTRMANDSYTLTFDSTGTVTSRTGIMCTSNGTDTNSIPIFPGLCGSTLNFPRFALSDGKRLFIADGGNDRVLIFNQIPTQNAAAADAVLGQPDAISANTSDTTGNDNTDRRAATDAIRTPTSLAWDGNNLYVAEPFSRRILIFSPETGITTVRNAASLEVFAVGDIALTGTITANDQLTVTIAKDSITTGTDYKYKVKKDDTLATVALAMVVLINSGSGDANVLASTVGTLSDIRLTARTPGATGNNISVKTTLSSNATLVATVTNMSGGGSAAKMAAGTLISIFGDNLAESAAAAPDRADPLPTELAGVQVYVDGLRIPLLYVSGNQINAQLPFEVLDANSASLYVRTTRADGSVTVTDAAGVPIVPANPGIFATGGVDPRPAIAVHSSSQATATISVDGTARPGETVSITIGYADTAKTYSYTVQASDSLASVRDALIQLINTQDTRVEAFAGGEFQRIRLRARATGSSGNGLQISSVSSTSVILSAYNTTLCCANIAGAPITEDNPALPGETITVFATGAGMVQPDAAKYAVYTGYTYKGPYLNQPNEFVSSLAGAKTANVLYAGMKPGSVGIYQMDLELNPDLPTDPATQLTIAQNVFVSNIVTIPVKNPTQ